MNDVQNVLPTVLKAELESQVVVCPSAKAATEIPQQTLHTTANLQQALSFMRVC